MEAVNQLLKLTCLALSRDHVNLCASEHLNVGGKAQYLTDNLHFFISIIPIDIIVNNFGKKKKIVERWNSYSSKV